MTLLAPIKIDFDLPKQRAKYMQITPGAAWAKVLAEPTATERIELKNRIKALLTQQNAVLVAHYYVHLIHWKWRDLAVTIRRKLSWSVASGSWERRPKYSILKNVS